MTQPHYIDRELAEIVSDEEIARVHGSANFGSMPPRQVVNDGISKIAVGYHCGHTQFSILREHGLITKPKGMSYDCNLTKKGKRYFRVLSSRPASMEAVAWREKVARLLCEQRGLDPDEHVIGGQATNFEDFGPRWKAARHGHFYGFHDYEEDADAILALIATHPTQGGEG